MLFQHSRRRSHRRRVAVTYARLVEQARVPELFSALGVPDTVMGRCDAILVHVFLMLHRLKGEGSDADGFAQALFDHLFADMDRSLRELGVGDLSVGKKVKTLAKGFYGRIVAYERALEAGDDEALRDALRRNLYADGNPSDRQVAAMVAYVRQEAERLATVPLARICEGEIGSPSAPVAV